MEKEESKSSFLWKNLLRGLAWFGVIITAYIFAREDIRVYQLEINQIGNQLPLLLAIFTVSEIIFGIIPPELFMLIWQSKGNPSEYVLNLSYLTLISYAAGVIGYYIGRYFSLTRLYQQISERYLKQYDEKLKKYGLYLVLVGAVTPVPFSATCMLAGSVNSSFRDFLLVCISRILRFAVYGWMVWTFPSWFS
ncbi:MAG: VTT domain-containing protein [Bacteroidetes bacterium]|nr:VTT domain-containing protein [Bacteroidota bacterium]MBS1975787.1 VTT domain-containing protein [Bacteroidota bacterium]